MYHRYEITTFRTFHCTQMLLRLSLWAITLLTYSHTLGEYHAADKWQMLLPEWAYDKNTGSWICCSNEVEMGVTKPLFAVRSPHPVAQYCRNGIYLLREFQWYGGYKHGCLREVKWSFSKTSTFMGDRVEHSRPSHYTHQAGSVRLPRIVLLALHRPSEETLNRDPSYLVLYARGSKKIPPRGQRCDLCVDSHPWLWLCLECQVSVKSGISDWSMPSRCRCDSKVGCIVV